MDKPHVYFFCTDKSLIDVFNRYPHNISIQDEGDEFVVSLWNRVKPQLRTSLQTIGLNNIEKIGKL